MKTFSEVINESYTQPSTDFISFSFKPSGPDNFLFSFENKTGGKGTLTLSKHYLSSHSFADLVKKLGYVQAEKPRPR